MNVKRLIRNAAVLAGCLVMSSASFAVTTIKVASVAPARSSWDVEQRRIGKEWADITNGEVELQFMTTLCVPFMFRNQEEVNAVLEEFTPRLQKPLNDKGYVILGWFNIGWAYFFTKNPAHTPNELRQQRLSVGGLTSPALSNAFKAAGFLTQDVPIDKVREFEKEYIEFMNTSRKDIMDRLAKGEYSDEITNVLTEVAKDLTKKYKK